MKEYENNKVFLGDIGIGSKASLIEWLIDNKFDENQQDTYGGNHFSILIQINLGVIKLTFWDTPGQKRLRSLYKNFINKSLCIVLIKIYLMK